MLNSPDDHAMQESSASLSTESLSRIISGGVRIASPRVHCWAYVQGLCQNPVCPYVHPRDIAPFIIHTPCLTWPKCGGPFICRFQHSVATIPPAPVSDPVDPAPIALPARQIRMTAPVTEYTVSPNSTLVSGPESTIPAGAYQLDGTTYFPLDVFNPQISCVPTASEIQGNAAPSHNWTHHYDDDRMNRTPQRRGVASHRKARSEWVQPPTTPVEAHIDLPRTQQHAADDRLTSTSDNEFPYRPPKNQRVGHARRISVTIKRT
ncbi:hypothetical protein BJ138DRAFT_1140784 [Hygrophoropsis aurantiaca]|uniref:Uncharacterized protein n=1 Tax=Hygrophoropsis aurantiaca TaxID=72124 RepID=A0ACB8AQQ7_9AGAM|nr:hypothetical protein BJ138DRAFT_1140784 [Hygrophoropsis aurantiaca]